MPVSKTSLTAFSILAILGLAISGAVWGARTDFELESLRGLSGVYVVVQTLSPEIVTDGLTVEALKSTINKRLSAAGIKLLAKGDTLSSRDGILLVALSSVKSKTGVHACSIDVELIQVTTLARTPDKPSPATTWASGIVAVVSPENVSHLSDTVCEAVDDFVKDYNSANSTSGAGPKIPIPDEKKL
ncbi:MAG: hypothetical protein ABFD49_11295 [Armatimonadota bacterium]|nr:hypothetical protein [bacterium]